MKFCFSIKNMPEDKKTKLPLGSVTFKELLVYFSYLYLLWSLVTPDQNLRLETHNCKY